MATARSRDALDLRRRPFPPDEMSPWLDALSLKFAIAIREAPAAGLDVGCGDGVAAVAALARGAHIAAVDPDPQALFKLLAHVPPEQYPRLRARVGRLPELDFKALDSRAPRFAAVHAARVLHRLDGAALRCTLAKFYRWLYPEGRLYLSALTPRGAFWDAFRTVYVRRTVRGAQWPGYIDDVSPFLPRFGWRRQPIHLLDENTLQRELEKAGFLVEETSCYPLPWDESQICCAMVARCG